MSKQKYTSTILITGGTQGLGYHCALSLARALPTTLIVLASRTDPSNSVKTINTTLKQSNVTYMPLDLSSLAKVRAFVKTFTAASLPPLSALVLNAGIQSLDPTAIHTVDGIERHFGINHVAHTLLFHLLAPQLTPDARVIVVSSGLHDPEQGKEWGISPKYTTPEEAAIGSGDDSGRIRYATSKAANAIWAFALGNRMAVDERHVAKTVLAFDPGLMFGTNFARDASGLLQWLNRWVLPKLTWLFRALVNNNINRPEESGSNLAWLVLGDEVKGKKAMYFEKRKERKASVQARDVKIQDELWRWTVDRVLESEEERKRFDKIE